MVKYRIKVICKLYKRELSAVENLEIETLQREIHKLKKQKKCYYFGPLLSKAGDSGSR